MSRLSSGGPTSNVHTALAAGRLGVPAVMFFVLSAAAPLTVVAGVVTTGYAVTGVVAAMPLAFLVVGAVLAVFSVGYVAMARRVANAGALYSYVTHGLGRPAGVAAAWMALLAYNALQVGLYGAIGAAAAPLLHDWAGLTLPWWAIALVAWAVVAVLGLLRVDLNGRVLAVLLCAELAVIAVYSVANLAHPAGGTVSLATSSPTNLAVPGAGAVLVLAVLGYVGFEGAVVFSEESRNPARTVPAATYASVAVIGITYALASWAMTVAVGADRIVDASRELGPELLFTVAGIHLGTTAVHIGHALFLTSVAAAMIAFHNACARYTFALGREGVLPKVFGRTGRRTGAPAIASLTQSAIGLTVIVGYAVAGLDPLVQLFFYAGTGGGFGVLLLLTLAALAIVAHFIRRPSLDTTWQTRYAPIIATVALAVMVVLAVANFATLLGVDPTSPLRWAIPAAYPTAALLGLAWALVLRQTRPDVYAGIGLGADAATARTPAVADVPAAVAVKPPYPANPSYHGRAGDRQERQ